MRNWAQRLRNWNLECIIYLSNLISCYWGSLHFLQLGWNLKCTNFFPLVFFLVKNFPREMRTSFLTTTTFTQDSFISRCGGAGVEAKCWELESLVKLGKAQNKNNSMNIDDDGWWWLLFVVVDDDDDDDDDESVPYPIGGRLWPPSCARGAQHGAALSHRLSFRRRLRLGMPGMETFGGWTILLLLYRVHVGQEPRTSGGRKVRTIASFGMQSCRQQSCGLGFTFFFATVGSCHGFYRSWDALCFVREGWRSTTVVREEITKETARWFQVAFFEVGFVHWMTWGLWCWSGCC